MYLFEKMPLSSRVWIYQANRELTNTELEHVKKHSEVFISQWTSHQNLMHACIKLLYNHFIIIVVDEQTAPASGCGIDKSVKFIQELEQNLSISLLDRTMVAYRIGGKTDPIETCHINDLKNLPEKKTLYVFNNLVTTKEDFEKNWEIPIQNSWHLQFV